MIDKDFNIFLQYLDVFFERHSTVRSFIPFPYQQKLLNIIENNRYTIFNKYRQGGFSTFMLAWGLHKALTEFDKEIVYFHPFDRMAISHGYDVSRMLDVNDQFLSLMTNRNGHQIEFATGSTMRFYSAQAAKGKQIDYLILDEAAWFRYGGLNQFWKGIFPYIERGGKAIIFSNLNPDEESGDFSFNQMVKDAKHNLNLFTCMETNYLENKAYFEKYLGEDWENHLRRNLGERGFQMEFLQIPVTYEYFL